MMNDSQSNLNQIMVFRPSWEEFQNFTKYVDYMEKQGGHLASIAKVIPPSEWTPCKDGYDISRINFKIQAPLCQIVTGKNGFYHQIGVKEPAMTVQDYEKKAKLKCYSTPELSNYDDIERAYWRNIRYVPPIYGSDIQGTLIDPTVEVWNINKLGTILDYIYEDYDLTIAGVNTSYLYFGMWKSTFAWHTEDMDLYSINYVHFGYPKTWYAIPPEYGQKLEHLVKNFYVENNLINEENEFCHAYLRHKMTLISPQVLKHYGIPCNRITQQAGEFIITFPYGYHSGFNHGFNCAEATNFATQRWIEFGKKANQYSCTQDTVKFPMDTFVRRFQPERYENWIRGLDE